jgi:hypothetical protein
MSRSWEVSMETVDEMKGRILVVLDIAHAYEWLHHPSYSHGGA